MNELFVASSDSLAEGQRQFVEHGKQTIGILRANGALRAFLNVCPHQGGPVCEGLMIHKVEEVIDADHCYRGMRFDPETLHVVCPWHGYEFEIDSGLNAGDGRMKLRQYEVREREGNVYVVV